MEVLLEKHLHQVDADEAITLLDSDADKGLDLFEIQSRQERFGPNSLPMQVGHGPLITFLLQFHQPLIYILLVAAGITAALHEWIDAGVIFAVVLVNAVIGFAASAHSDHDAARLRNAGCDMILLPFEDAAKEAVNELCE